MKTGGKIYFFVVAVICFLLFHGSAFSNLSNNGSGVFFTENLHQWPGNVLYKGNIPGGNIFLEKNCFTYLFLNTEELRKLGHKGESTDSSLHLHAFKVEFTNAENPVVSGIRDKGWRTNYFFGKDPKNWARGARNFEEVLYDGLWKQVDLRVSSQENNLKYDLIVKRGGNPKEIQLKFSGQDDLYIKDGNLFIQTSVGLYMERKPYAYQETRNGRKEIPCNFILKGKFVSFEFPDGFDRFRDLIIDPTLVASTYTGSTSDNWGYTATFDEGKNIYTAGIASSTGYPVTMGAFQQTFAGGGPSGYPMDIVISKLNPEGTQMMFSTYLGGTDNEQPHSMIVDKNGSLVVFGRTLSSDFPVTSGSYDESFNGGSDIIISKLDTSGGLVASTFVGGTLDDAINISANSFSSLKYIYADDSRGEVNIDEAGNIYVATCSKSSNFPITGGFQTTFNGGIQDGVVLKLNNSLSALVWSTFLGGSGDDAAYALTFDNYQNVYVTGGTTSSNFPVTSGTINPTYKGGIDGFIVRLSPGGSNLLQGTFIGTSSYDQSYFIQTDKEFNIYVFGQTSGAYPVSDGVYSNTGGSQFIHKLDPSLSNTIFSTVFGSGTSTPNISPSAFLVDTCEKIYAAGWAPKCIGTGTGKGDIYNMPITANAYQKTTASGCGFYFFVLNRDALSLSYATYFGGATGTHEHVDGGTSRFDKRGVMYQAVCAGCGGLSDFPVLPTAWSTTNNSSNCNNAVIKIDFELIKVESDFMPLVSKFCAMTPVPFINLSTGASEFVWDFGDSTGIDSIQDPVHTFTNPGIYKVRLISSDPSGCSIPDTMFQEFEILNYPVFSLGTDTSLCGDSVITLDPKADGISFLWSTGETTPTIIAGEGKYWIQVSNGSCESSDTIAVEVFSKPSLSGDTTICDGNSIILNAENPGSNFLWSTGETSQSIEVKDSGLYWVQITLDNCTTADSMYLNTLQPPVVNLGNDVLLCPGDSVILDAQNPQNDVLWSTGITLQTIVVSTTGNYYVEVFDGFCTSQDNIDVSVFNTPELGSDSTVCKGTEIILDGGSGADGFLWSTGKTTRTIKVYESGKYWVKKNLENCSGTDTINITLANPPTLDLGPDRIVCEGDSVRLDTKTPNDNVLWSSGESQSIIYPIQSGQYSVIVSNNYCIVKDTIKIILLKKPQLSGDTSVCNTVTSEITLYSGNYEGSYLWSDGSVGDSIVVNSSGDYWFSLGGEKCRLYDTVSVKFWEEPVVELGPSDTLCDGDTILLNGGGPGILYKWSNNSSADKIFVTEGGSYWVEVVNGLCYKSDTVSFRKVSSPDLLGDTIFCEGRDMYLDADPGATEYLWSTGEKGQTILVSKEAKYWVEVKKEGCILSDTVEIRNSFGRHSLYFPNTFTPDRNGLNEIFKAEGNDITFFELWIFNRWGEEIFYSNDLNYGWNGTYKEDPAQTEIYVWMVDYSTKCTGKKKFRERGHVLLLR